MLRHLALPGFLLPLGFQLLLANGVFDPDSLEFLQATEEIHAAETCAECADQKRIRFVDGFTDFADGDGVRGGHMGGLKYWEKEYLEPLITQLIADR